MCRAMSNNPFERFYDTEIEIVKIKKGSGYSDRGRENTEVLKKIICDIQSFNGGLAANEYGLSVECQYRIFANSSPYITEGNYARIADKLYKIIYAADWNFGKVAILQIEE